MVAVRTGRARKAATIACAAAAISLSIPGAAFGTLGPPPFEGDSENEANSTAVAVNEADSESDSDSDAESDAESDSNAVNDVDNDNVNLTSSNAESGTSENTNVNANENNNANVNENNTVVSVVNAIGDIAAAAADEAAEGDAVAGVDEGPTATAGQAEGPADRLVATLGQEDQPVTVGQGEELPFTGAPLWSVGAAGLASLLFGGLLRRKAASLDMG